MAHTLDITRDHCPMTFVKTKLVLARLAPGEQLEVLLTEGEPLDNVPRTAREAGHRVLAIRRDGAHYSVLIEKA